MAKVRCVQCKELIYDCSAVEVAFSGEPVHATHFVPLNSSDHQPQDGTAMSCPRCDQIFTARAAARGGVVLLLEDGSWWPHPPLQG